MKTHYNLKNFRAFDNKGVDLDLAPLTILTGCNSSGKSSITKSIFLLDSFLRQVSVDIEQGHKINLKNYKLDFSTYPNTLLGRFDRVVNRDSADKSITFEYVTFSNLLLKDITVQLVFKTDENDQLNNGYLQECAFLDGDQVIYSSKRGQGNLISLSSLEDDFFQYLLAKDFLEQYSSTSFKYEIDGEIDKEEYEDKMKTIFEGFKKMGKQRIQSTAKILPLLSLVRSSKKDRTPKYPIDCLCWNVEHKSLFYIPLVETLKSSTKESLRTSIADLNLPVSSEIMKIAIEKICEDFMNSEASNFGDYFHDKEIQYLSEIHIDLKENSSPAIPSLSDIDLWPNYIAHFESAPVVTYTVNSVKKYSAQNKKDYLQKKLEEFKQIEVSFPYLYENLMRLNELYTTETSPFYSYVDGDYVLSPYYEHTVIPLIEDFLENLIVETLTPEWVNRLSYVSSSRIAVKRLYTFDSSDDFTNLLKNYFEIKRNFFESKMIGYTPGAFLSKWVKNFQLGEDISLEIDDEGLGVQLKLRKNLGSHDSYTLLADEGYGITQLFSILLQIETAIMARKKQAYTIYGIKDILELDRNQVEYCPQTIVIEEPEIHLHPKYQSLLADMFNDAYRNYNIQFVLETHSEYLIRKEQVLVANQDAEYHIDSTDISLVYVNEPGDFPRSKNIGICKDGYLNNSFGSGFFDEAIQLSQQLL